MKNFKRYFNEVTGAKKWDFRIKVAGAVTTEQADLIKALLNKYQVSEFKKVGTTPIQSLPLDFPKIKNSEVTIFETVLDYPTTQFELRDYLANSLGVPKDNMVVRRPGEDLEVYQEPHEPREGALLSDGEYKEATNANFEDYYGDKYNTSFLKELNDLLKLQRKARGEEVPTEGAAHYNVDEAQNNNSPIKQSGDPRKNTSKGK
jgi:hypothetical protein